MRNTSLVTRLLFGAGLILLILPFLPIGETPVTGWAVFLGRFHPLIIHFPIVVVFVILLLEFWPDKDITLDKSIKLLWGLAALSAVASALAGYLLYRSDDYSGELVRNHFWIGVGSSCLIIFAFYLRQKTDFSLILYRVVLVVTASLIGITGHLGGSLTHGEGFLTDAIPQSFPETQLEKKDPSQYLVYEDLIVPMLEERCLSCHNSHKTKGGLDMSNYELMLKGGKSEKASVVSGKSAESELYHRAALPMADEDRMPPKGKPGFSSDELQLLAWWIDKGGKTDMTLAEAEPPTEIQSLIQAYIPKSIKAQQTRLLKREERMEMLQMLQSKADKWGVVIEPDPDTDSTLFAISMKLPPRVVTDEIVAEWLPFAAAFSSISLPGAEVSDESFFYFSRMPNLRKLLLPRTCVNGKAITQLIEIPQLEILNVSHTAFDDTAAIYLRDFQQLKSAYMYNTEVGDNMIEALDAYLPKMKVSKEEGPYY